MSYRHRSRSPSGGLPIYRLLSLALLLALVGVAIVRLRGNAPPVLPDVPTLKQDAAPSALLTPDRRYRGPEPAEQEQFRRESDAIVDNATSILGIELPAYWRVVRWVQMQSLNDLRGGGFPHVSFHDLAQHPGKHRGKPIQVELLVRRVLSYELNDPADASRSHRLYELWGWPTASDGWLYVVVSPELPQGFPIGKEVEVSTTVYGYFFKLQGYQPADAKPNAKPLMAPLLIGRVTPVARIPAASSSQEALSVIILAVGSAALVVVIIGWIVNGRRRRSRVTEVAGELLDLPTGPELE